MGLTLTALPVEISQAVLENLSSLHDLQRAILSCRYLYDCYQASRSLIRQRVFHRQVFGDKPLDISDVSSVNYAIEDAEEIVIELEKRTPREGIILREVLWHCLISYSEETLANALEDVVCTLSLGLASAYRRQNELCKAQQIERHALNLLCQRSQIGVNSKTTNMILSWLRDTVTRCSSDRDDFSHLNQLCLEAYKLLDVTDHKSLLVLSKLVSLFLINYDENNHKLDGRILLDTLWLALEKVHIVMHTNGEYCYYCLETVKALTNATDYINISSTVAISRFERVWNALPLRSPVFETWSHLFVECHRTAALDGALKVWTRLRDHPDPDEFESYDLEWGRRVMFELAVQDGNNDRRIVFQRSVFALMKAGTPKQYALGRNLADEYEKRGDIAEAISVREEIGNEMDMTSNLYVSWAMSLKNLYQKAHREEDVEQIDACISRAREARANEVTDGSS